MGILEVSILAYVGVGLVAIAVWPLRKQFVKSLSPSREERLNTRRIAPLTAIKTFIFVFLAFVIAVLLWPIVSIDNLRDKAKAKRRHNTTFQKEDEDLESWIGRSSELQRWFEDNLWLETDTLDHRAPARPTSRDEWTMSALRRFEKDCRKVDRRLQERLMEALLAICNDPMVPNGDTKKPLDGNLSGMWRYRIGYYRVVYRPNSNSRTITIIAFGPRQEIYARLVT